MGGVALEDRFTFDESLIGVEPLRFDEDDEDVDDVERVEVDDDDERRDGGVSE